MSVLTESAAWRALTTLAEADPATTTSARFERDPGRAARYSAEACGLYLDYSKQRIGDEVLGALLALLVACPSRAQAASCGDDVGGLNIACSCGDDVVSDTVLGADDPVARVVRAFDQHIRRERATSGKRP